MRNLATQQILEELYGRPRLLETVSLTQNGSKLSSAIPKGSRILIQSSGACTVVIGDSTATGVTAANGGLSLIATEKYYCCLKTTDTNVAFYTTAAGVTANIYVME